MIFGGKGISHDFLSGGLTQNTLCLSISHKPHETRKIDRSHGGNALDLDEIGFDAVFFFLSFVSL